MKLPTWFTHITLINLASAIIAIANTMSPILDPRTATEVIVFANILTIILHLNDKKDKQ